MMGAKIRNFAPLPDLSLEELVPEDNFYRRLRKKSQSISPTRVITTRRAATKSPMSCTAPRYQRKDPAALVGDIPAEGEGFEPPRALA